MTNTGFRASTTSYGSIFGRFTLKMDDPQTPLRRLRDDGSVEVIYTDRIYYINFVMQFRYGAGSEYKLFPPRW